MLSLSGRGEIALSSAPAVLHRSRRRTLAIHVYHDRVEVRAPLRASLRDIQMFVESKQVWIEARLEESRQRYTGQPRLIPGACLSVMGEPCVLEWRQAARRSVSCEEGVIRLAGSGLDESLATRMFQMWLSQQAKDVLELKALNLAKTLELEARCSGFRYRYTRSLWGRCSSKGEILFNPQILLAPVPVIDYLVAHEVSHLRYMNHSGPFWALVDSVCPDWRHSRDWLRLQGHTLQLRC